MLDDVAAGDSGDEGNASVDQHHAENQNENPSSTTSDTPTLPVSGTQTDRSMPSPFSPGIVGPFLIVIMMW